MPILFRSGSASVRMYADDHRPPHFHIVGPDFEVVVKLPDLQIIAGTARARDIKSAMAWAKANGAFLAAKWSELNERG